MRVNIIGGPAAGQVAHWDGQSFLEVRIRQPIPDRPIETLADVTVSYEKALYQPVTFHLPGADKATFLVPAEWDPMDAPRKLLDELTEGYFEHIKTWSGWPS